MPVVPLEVEIASRDGGRGERGGSYHECRVESRDTAAMPPILPIEREWREAVLGACGAPTPLSLPGESRNRIDLDVESSRLYRQFLHEICLLHSLLSGNYGESIA